MLLPCEALPAKPHPSSLWTATRHAHDAQSERERGPGRSLGLCKATASGCGARRRRDGHRGEPRLGGYGTGLAVAPCQCPQRAVLTSLCPPLARFSMRTLNSLPSGASTPAAPRSTEPLVSVWVWVWVCRVQTTGHQRKPGRSSPPLLLVYGAMLMAESAWMPYQRSTCGVVPTVPCRARPPPLLPAPVRISSHPTHPSLNEKAAGHVAVCQAVLDTLHTRDAGPAPPDRPAAGKWSRLAAALLDGRDGASQTPLMAACARGHAGVAAYLLAAGADPTLVDWTNLRSALHLAALGGHVATLRMLCDEGTRWAPRGGAGPRPPGPLRDTVLPDAQVGQAKFLDLRSYGGLTPLHCAVVTGSLEAVRVLLAAGAAIMVRTDGEAFVGSEFLVPGSTPLHMAVLMGHASIVHALLQVRAVSLCVL